MTKFEVADFAPINVPFHLSIERPAQVDTNLVFMMRLHRHAIIST